MWVFKIEVLLFIISLKEEEAMMNNGKGLKEDLTFIALVFPNKVSNHNGARLINLLKVALPIWLSLISF